MFGLSFAAWITLANIVILLSLALFTRIKTDVIFLVMMAIFLVSGVLDIDQTFSGFTSNAAMIAVFFAVMIGAMRRTHIVQWAMFRLMGNESRQSRALVKVMMFAATLSTMIPNLVLGMLLYSGVDDWARRQGKSQQSAIRSSKLLLPVAYAICFGSGLTIIGRTGGLVWSDMYKTYTGEELSIFAPFWLGLLCMIVWMGAIMLLRNRLPDKDSSQEIAEKTDEFILELQVPQGSSLCGKTIAESGLYASEDFSLLSITAYDNIVSGDINPDICLLGGDKLLFSGDVEKLMELTDRLGLVSETKDLKDGRGSGKRMMFVSTSYKQLAAVPRGSSFIGKTIADTEFEQRYNVVVMAFAREGEFLTKKPRNIEIKAGDLIILNGNKLPWEELRHELIRQDSSQLINYDWHSVASAVILLVVLLLSVLNVVPLVEGAMIGAIATALCGCISHKDALSSIPWTTVIIMAGSCTLGLALKTSGLAEVMSQGLLFLCGSNVIVSLIVLTGATLLLTQLIADNAVIPLMLPLSITTATHLHCPTFPFALAIFMAATAKMCTSFCGPHMVECAAQGQYTEKEMMRMGCPILVLMFITILIGITFYF